MRQVPEHQFISMTGPYMVISGNLFHALLPLHTPGRPPVILYNVPVPGTTGEPSRGSSASSYKGARQRGFFFVYFCLGLQIVPVSSGGTVFIRQGRTGVPVRIRFRWLVIRQGWILYGMVMPCYRYWGLSFSAFLQVFIHYRFLPLQALSLLDTGLPNAVFQPLFRHFFLSRMGWSYYS